MFSSPTLTCSGSHRDVRAAAGDQAATRHLPGWITPFFPHAPTAPLLQKWSLYQKNSLFTAQLSAFSPKNRISHMLTTVQFPGGKPHQTGNNTKTILAYTQGNFRFCKQPEFWISFVPCWHPKERAADTSYFRSSGFSTAILRWSPEKAATWVQRSSFD